MLWELVPPPEAPLQAQGSWRAKTGTESFLSPSKEALWNIQGIDKERNPIQRTTPRAKDAEKQSQVFSDDQHLMDRFQGMETGMVGRGHSGRGQARGSEWTTIGQS